MIANPQGEGILMRDGSIVKDPRLGRLIEFDERSRNYNVRKLFTTEHDAPRSYRWKVPQSLDQKRNPSCVGFAWSHELCARPKMTEGITEESALQLYYEAQKLDEWSGEGYEGTSVLGGAKAAQAQGKILEYRWAFDTLDLAIAISYFGGAVIGVNWYDSMFETDVDGYLHIGGKIAGGHALYVPGFSVFKWSFWCWQSWGLEFGLAGGCWIRFEDMDRLLKENGEACLPTLRIK